MSKLSVLFVCTENICRSPLAEALLRMRLKQLGLSRRVSVDSAGTYCSSPGLKPDPRSVKVGKSHRLCFWRMRARRVQPKDFERFDLIVAMDRTNRDDLLELCPEHLSDKIRLMMAYAPDLGFDDVPDPYYGNANGFVRVYELINDAMEGLLYDIGSI